MARGRDGVVLLTVSEAARLIGCTTFFVYDLISDRRIEHLPSPDRGPNGSRMYVLRRRDVLRYMRLSREAGRRGTLALPCGPGLISGGEAARILGHGHTLLERMIRNGTLHRIMDGRQSVPWYRRSEVEALVRGRARVAPPRGCLWVAEYAKRIGVTRQAVHLALKDGRLFGGSVSVPGNLRPRTYIKVPR